MKSLYFFAIAIFSCGISFSQAKPSDSYISWSSSRRLTLDDFGIKTKDGQSTTSFAQFSMGFDVHGFDFLTKNFNKKVHNYFIKSASWIDTTADVQASIRYEQTLFDLCEIYTRQFRKALKENKRKIAGGTEFINELNAKIMADFSTRRITYDAETKFGNDNEKQLQWQEVIQKELTALQLYSNE